MATFDEDSEDTAQDEAESASAPSSWSRPLLLAAVGLVLMLGGHAATSYALAGHLAVYVGLILFVIAAILMYRSSP